MKEDANNTENKAKYTEGPWRVETDPTSSDHDGYLKISYHLYSPEGERVTSLEMGRLHLVEDTDKIAEAFGNMRLIASAPDMLEALKFAFDYFKTNEETDEDGFISARYEIARAIMKRLERKETPGRCIGYQIRSKVDGSFPPPYSEKDVIGDIKAVIEFLGTFIDDTDMEHPVGSWKVEPVFEEDIKDPNMV